MMVAGAGPGCVGRVGDGSLQPPRNAPPWEEVLSRGFDDGFTPEPVNLVGRAPHDVLDQRLFIERLGLSNLVLLVTVEQVWARGRRGGGGDEQQHLDVRIEKALLGEVPQDIDAVQTVIVRDDDDLPGSLQGERLVMFLRWAPDHDPPYHHHLMPASDEIVAWIETAVEQAREAGAITVGGKETGSRARRRAARKERRRQRREKKKNSKNEPPSSAP